MELTMDRSEGTRGLLFKKPVYYLTVDMKFTPEELKLIKKHNWDKNPMCHPPRLAGIGDGALHIGSFTRGKIEKYDFDSVGNLQAMENEIIENSKKLKGQLETVAGFTSGGPRKIEL